MYKIFFKHTIDILVSILLLIFVCPIIVLSAILLTLSNRGNPFFIQKRPGKKGKIFKIIKFKTMSDKKDIYGNLLPDKDRLTLIGKFVRKTSIDELPQLINVLKGDMSLIGPRPLLPEYIPLYNKEQKRRHEVRPGITGWAQVNGRNAISWEDKFKFDVWYVNNMSLIVDVKIVLKTLKKVFLSEGINSKDSVTMEKFIGTKINEYE